jgi:endoglucanase
VSWSASGAPTGTPLDVTLRWAEDSLHNWKDANWEWPLCNFRGTFGILDSERGDVTYEDYHGHQLDRKFLDLLQRY